MNWCRNIGKPGNIYLKKTFLSHSVWGSCGPNMELPAFFILELLSSILSSTRSLGNPRCSLQGKWWILRIHFIQLYLRKPSFLTNSIKYWVVLDNFRFCKLIILVLVSFQSQSASSDSGADCRRITQPLSGKGSDLHCCILFKPKLCVILVSI